MRNKRALMRSVIALTVLAAIFLSVPISHACGPFTLSAMFSFTVHPEYPLEKFASGDLGVVQPTFARSYLYVAYRYLNGMTLAPQQQKEAVELWQQRLNFDYPTDGQDWIKEWNAVREKVPGVSAPPNIGVYRSREKPNEYENYLNCQSDAFKNAAATLTERIAKFGADSPGVKDWVVAQDEVFANCAEGRHIPQPAASDLDSLLKSDREYQIAAANFYATDFAEATSLYKQIGDDKSSPWRSSAPYLLARTFIRQASLAAPEKKNDSLSAAEKQLDAILKNNSLQQWHAPATRLVKLVRLRLYPEIRMHELAHALLERNQDGDFKQNLWDYTTLLDEYVDDETDEQKSDAPASLRSEELTDWLVNFQSSKPESVDYALNKWQSNSSLTWLVSALSKVDAKHPKAEELLAAAAKVPPESPGYPSVSFHSVRLLMESDRFNEARAKLDELLRKHRSRLNISSLNLALSQRMLVATSLEDFLIYAQRVPASFSWDDDGREVPTPESELSDEVKPLSGKPLFDLDATQLLNKRFPLELWRQAAESKALSTHLRKDVAQAAWIRAVVLEDPKTAEDLVPTVKQLIPELGPFLDDYALEKNADAKRFSAIYTWLKFPGMEPVVDEGTGRTIKLGEQDIYRDNWWCGVAFESSKEQTQSEKSDSDRKPSITSAKQLLDSMPKNKLPLFFTEAQRTAAEREAANLIAVGAAPNYLCRQVIAWATKNPNDPRVPEALHLAVRTTRYGCTNSDSARWSKAAYDMLHKRYPTSTWAKKTPYWFKD